MTEEPREQTSDWIMESYIKDDSTYGCTHGIYKLIKPHQLICTKCGETIINEQEMESFYQYLCKRD